MELKFNDLKEEIADLNEISKEILAEQDLNVFDTDNIDSELTNKAHIIDSDGEIFALED